MGVHRYAMPYRPPSFATVPAGYITLEPAPTDDPVMSALARHGFVVYDRALTRTESDGYELIRMLTSEDVALIVDAVADELAEYRDDLLEMAAEEPAYFRSAVASQVDLHFGEYRTKPHIEDFEGFTQSVLLKLRATIPA